MSKGDYEYKVLPPDTPEGEGTKWVTFTRDVKGPKLVWIQRCLEALGIGCDIGCVTVMGYPILVVEREKFMEAWDWYNASVSVGGLLHLGHTALADLPDDHPIFKMESGQQTVLQQHGAEFTHMNAEQLQDAINQAGWAKVRDEIFAQSFTPSEEVAMVVVESSQVRALGYLLDSEVLYVQFNGRPVPSEGPFYRYSNVTPEQWQQLMEDESKGRWIGQNVKNTALNVCEKWDGAGWNPVVLRAVK